MKRRKRRSSETIVVYQKNPKISPWVWVLGGAALLGGGYLTYMYFKQHITLAPGVAYAAPSGTVVLTLPAGATWVGLVQTSPVTLSSTQTLATPGSTGPVTFPAVTGITYTASWTDSTGAQTATVTIQ
jgi:hypothetical protein